MGPAPSIVVVDANVLFPLTLRDTMVCAAAADFYQLRWRKQILDEMERNSICIRDDHLLRREEARLADDACRDLSVLCEVGDGEILSGT
jgi:hypothetical protein